jgi:hypothetical protein
MNLIGGTNNLVVQGISLLKKRMHVPILHQGNEGNEEFYVGACGGRVMGPWARGNVLAECASLASAVADPLQGRVLRA